MEKKIVILAASLGGPPLVNEILSSLAPSFELPLFVLQQMESDFSEPLTSAWGKTSSIHLFRLESEMNIRDGVAYVIPYGIYPQFEGLGDDLTARPMMLKNSNDFYGQWKKVINECLDKFSSDLILVLLTDSGLEADTINASLEKIMEAGGTVIRCNGAESSYAGDERENDKGYLQMEMDQIISFLQKISGGKYISV